MRKAFSLSFIQQMLLVLVCLYGAQFVTELAGAVDCGQPPVAVGPMSGLASSDVSATDVAAVKQYNSCMGKARRRDYFSCRHCCASCLTFLLCVQWNFLYMLYIPLGLGFLVYGGWRRHQMRKRFNIPGNEWEDYAVWLCCFPCALCQETRTLAENDVEDGVWPQGRGNGTGERQPLMFGTPSFMGGSLPKGKAGV